MKIKKIFLILVAAVALSSCAWAKTANDNKHFIVSRSGSEVTVISGKEVFDNAKILSQTDEKDTASVFLACIRSVSLACIFQSDKAKPKRTENDLFLCLISGVCFWDNFSVV